MITPVATEEVLRSFFGKPPHIQDMLRKRSSCMDDLLWIAAALRNNRAHNVVEIGTFKGLSACFIASNITGTLHTINISAAEMEIARDTVEECVLDNVEFHIGDSLKTLPTLLDKLRGDLSAVYIDGNHSYKYAMGEYLLAAPHIKDGIVIFDDADKLHPDGKADGGVPRAVEEIGATPVAILQGRVACKTFGRFQI